MNENKNQDVSGYIYAGAVAVALVFSFLLARSTWASWDFDGGITVNTLSAITETLPTFVAKDKEKSCFVAQLRDSLKHDLLSPVATEGLKSQDDKNLYEKRIATIKLIAPEKRCLKAAIFGVKDKDGKKENDIPGLDADKDIAQSSLPLVKILSASFGIEKDAAI